MVLPGRPRQLGYQIASPAPNSVVPRCAHFGVCGGCTQQDIEHAEQVRGKQDILQKNFAEFGQVTPAEWFQPLTGPLWNYRRKARMSARYVFKKERVLVGFRERAGRYVADMSECHVLDSRIADRLPQLASLIASLETFRRIPQLEVACGDASAALVFRHLDPLPEGDIQKLREFAQESGIGVYLQASGPDSIALLEPPDFELTYSLPTHGLTFRFEPADFIQVNGEMNRLMVDLAVELLAPEPGDRVLDLFCGLGNFTLPLARQGGHIVGVEGSDDLISRATENARSNGVGNAEFHGADLTLDPVHADWLREPYQKVLIDPPRSGAEEMLPHIDASGASRVVYISCNPATLARDAGILVREHGFALAGAGVIDMFPHTDHLESVALFERVE